MSMKVHQMKALEALVRHGSVTKAAAELRVSQPAVSRTIQQLEKELGLKLFKNVNGRLAPTRDAASLLPSIDRILGQIEDLSRHANDLRDGKRGVLRIALAPSCTLAVVKAGFAEFTRLAPGALLDLFTARTHEVVDLVAKGQMDLGFCQLHGMESHIVSHTSFAGSVVCVLPAEHPLATRSELSPEDLAEENLIMLSSEELTGRRIVTAFAKAGVALNCRMQVTQTLPAINLVAAGFGIALSDSFFADTLQSAAQPKMPVFYRDLKVIPLVPTIPIKLHLLSPANQPMNYLAEIFVDAVLA